MWLEVLLRDSSRGSGEDRDAGEPGEVPERGSCFLSEGDEDTLGMLVSGVLSPSVLEQGTEPQTAPEAAAAVWAGPGWVQRCDWSRFFLVLQ